MEDALRVPGEEYKEVWASWVLILVLMEDALREVAILRESCETGVLILVLMEDALRGSFQRH